MTTWWRSHEEETGPVRVYRPEGFPFPPARGREGFALHPDGRFDHLGPGRGDRPVVTAGTWERDGDRITAHVDGRRIDLDVVEETADVLRAHWRVG